MNYNEILTIEPDKRSGKPCIRGTRMTVTDVLEYLAGGMSEQEILEEFPDLTTEDIRACLAFAADRERRLAFLPEFAAWLMKLLFDQNLSSNLPQKLADIFPNSVHIRNLGIRDATDTEIWVYAKQNDFTIVSKDSDFQQRSLLYGHPPKFIWLRIGNCPVRTVEELLRKHSVSIHTFSLDQTKSHLLLP